ncbi:MAG: hypothetical protein WCA85_19365 [Paraburkholderia sp.]|uniref:hypothetical protein n=1 Tax=Paraburkholderia sp. TaxID=1926495 RepID=UPI003C5B0759
MNNSSFAQVKTVSFERIPDKSRHARSSNLLIPLPGGLNTVSTPVTGGLLAPVGLS